MCRNKKRTISCKHPGNVDNAQVEHRNPMRTRKRSANQPREVYPPGSRLYYKCDDGYILQGRSVLYCHNNGSWTSKPPFCEPDVIHYCENRGFVPHGNAKYVPPPTISSRVPEFDEYPAQAKLEFSCEDGYRLQGSRSVTCLSSGMWSDNMPSCVSDCGLSYMKINGKGSNGNKTNSGDWPWVVSISVNLNDEIKFICGGAVLNIHTVITAAHCLTHPMVSGRQLTLRFGKHHFGVDNDDDQVLVRKTSQWRIHPDYNKTTRYDSDIALVFLQHKILFSERVQPLCLPTSDSTAQNIVPGNIGYISGWGVTERGRFPDEMMLVKLPVVSNSQCEDEYKQHKLHITSNMFCVGHEDGRQTVCSGDSGSPFFFYDKRIERYFLEGLVSFTEEGQCGVTGKYAIFTKVFRFTDWITQLSTIKPNKRPA